MLELLELRRLLAATLDGSGNLVITGSANADTITLVTSGTDIVVTIQPENFNQAFATSSVNTITVNAGDDNDWVEFNSSLNKPSTVFGENGADTLIGGSGDDRLVGGAGDDVLDGGGSGDRLEGDTGTDTLTYESRVNPISVFMDGLSNDGEVGEGDDVTDTVDMVIGGAGNDRISSANIGGPRYFYGLGGNDTLVGSNDGDRLNGGAGNDDLRGFDGDDFLIGSFGRDVLNGGDGVDTQSYYNAGSAVVAENNARSLSGTAREQDNIKTDVENITGGNFADSLTGNAGNNVLTGGSGNDTITGLAGLDSLFGDAGDDALFAQDGEADSVDGGDDTDTADVDALLDSVANVP